MTTKKLPSETYYSISYILDSYYYPFEVLKAGGLYDKFTEVSPLAREVAELEERYQVLKAALIKMYEDVEHED